MNTQIESKCIQCQNAFDKKNSNHKFCSDLCRNRNFRQKNKNNFDSFADDIFEINKMGIDIISNIDLVIYRMSTHDDLEGKIEYQNAMDFLHKLKFAFQKLDGQNIDTQ